MSAIDTSKPVWRVRGRLPFPDGRRMTCFVNGDRRSGAIALAIEEGLHTVEQAWQIDIGTGKPLNPDDRKL